MRCFLPLLFFLPKLTLAQVSHQEFRFPVNPELRMNLSGYRAEISVIGSSGSELAVKVEQAGGDGSQVWSVEKTQNGEAISLRFANAEFKPGVNESRFPKLRVTVQGPGVPLDFYWADAKVSVQDWPSPAGIYLTKGEVRSAGGKGARRLFVRSGRIDLKGFEGVTEVESYQAGVSLADMKGTAEVSNFSGTVSVVNYDGVLHLKSYNGKFAVEKAKGEVAFDFNQADLKTQEVEGRISGDGKDSTLRLAYVGKANMSIKMQAGNVLIQSPKNSGSRINIGSEQGFLDVPATVKKTDTATLKLGQGRLDGQLDGSIFVRSKTGAISIK